MRVYEGAGLAGTDGASAQQIRETTLWGRIGVWILMIFLAAVGLTLFIGGCVLVANGGSAYYILAGAAVLATAVGLLRGSSFALKLYGALLAVTAAWGLWEVGLSGWALAPRLIAPAVIGIAFMTPAVRRAAAMASRWWVGAPLVGILIVFAAAVVHGDTKYGPLYGTLKLPATAAVDSENGEWRQWGRTLKGQRYAPLNAVNTDNVGKLKLAWQYDSDIESYGGAGHTFEATPLAIDGHLYLCVDRNVVVALDQEDGHEIWRYDPHTNLKGVYAATCRGVSYYESPQPVSECQKRILFGTQDARLIALDAESGHICGSFGTQGSVDLHAGLGEVGPGIAYPTSPPTIVSGLAVIGEWVTDGLSTNEPSGVVRAFDAVTGSLRWAWDIGRPDRTEMPPAGETYTRATPNAWGVFSGDESLGLVYLGTGNTTPDYFGATRSPESEKYSSSVVALDVATGHVRWSFQTVHHDIWDYDVMSQPVLVDVAGPEGKIPAVISTTKRGQLFMLDRRDGHSLDRIIEKPVPQDHAEGEWLSKTQPYTTGFPSVVGDDLREVDMWGLTPIDQLFCRITYKEARYEGQFTPPNLGLGIIYPGSGGGSNWGSATVDPDRNLLVVNTIHLADYGRLVPRAEADAQKAAAIASVRNDSKSSGVPAALRAGGHGSRYAYLQPQAGTPYAFWRTVFFSPLAVPCQSPPYGRLNVFDINTRQLLWSRPLGTAERSGAFEIESHLPIRLGTPTIGGSLATSGGLLFIGAAQDRYLRAFDIGSGKELWSFSLPSAAGATPMTYVSKKSRRQFVVIAAGGHPALTGPTGNHVLAFTIPTS